MQKITTFLWFNDNAEAAVNFYLSIFKSGKILQTVRYGKSGPGPAGSVMIISFELEGQRFTALNGGPHFTFTPAISLSVECKDQAEIDRLWDALAADGGEQGQCGWLTDKFGLSWQIVPRILPELMNEPAKAERVMQAVMPMKKLDLAALEKAAAGRS
jgi:predicted 3-demethylubiquinone-9 3-methyltransferase (glyoxalase superfamily)